jgi:acyl carrier protein
MMIDQKVVALVNDIFEESFEIEKKELQADKNIFIDLGLDSLDVVDLMVALQKKFNVKIRDDERIRNIRTMEELYDYVVQLKKEGAKPKHTPRGNK